MKKCCRVAKCGPGGGERERGVCSREEGEEREEGGMCPCRMRIPCGDSPYSDKINQET